MRNLFAMKVFFVSMFLMLWLGEHGVIEEYGMILRGRDGRKMGIFYPDMAKVIFSLFSDIYFANILKGKETYEEQRKNGIS